MKDEEKNPTAVSVNSLTPAVCKDENVSMFLDTVQYNQSYRAARLLSQSRDMIPPQYQGNESNCMLALNMAKSLGLTITMYFQWTYLLKGKLGLESKAIITIANQSGMFKRGIEFDEIGTKKDGDEWGFRAFAEDARYNTIIEETVTIGDAKAAGWITNTWWQKLPRMMLKYRSASFLIKFNRPELLGGMGVKEEMMDEAANPIDITDKVNADMEKTPGDSPAAAMQAKKAEEVKKKPKTEPKATSATEDKPKKTAKKEKSAEVQELEKVWRDSKNIDAIRDLVESKEFTVEEFDRITGENLKAAAKNWTNRILTWEKPRQSKKNGAEKADKLLPIVQDLFDAKTNSEYKAAFYHHWYQGTLTEELFKKIIADNDAVAASGWLLKFDTFNAQQPQGEQYEGEEEPPPEFS